MIDPVQIERALEGSTFIDKIYFFDEIDSTNNYARNTLNESNVLVLTNHQTSGKGRLGREWVSEKNCDLCFSIKKKFSFGINQISYINFYSAYALFKGIESFLFANFPKVQYEMLIKWPNDILLNQKKLCGILIENNQASGETVIGIGVNVNSLTRNRELENSSISLRQYLGKKVNLNELLPDILNSFRKYLKLLETSNLGILFELWKTSTNLIGKSIEYIIPNGAVFEAQVIDFNEDGSIKLKSEEITKDFYAGEIKISP